MDETEQDDLRKRLKEIKEHGITVSSILKECDMSAKGPEVSA